MVSWLGFRCSFLKLGWSFSLRRPPRAAASADETFDVLASHLVKLQISLVGSAGSGTVAQSGGLDFPHVGFVVETSRLSSLHLKQWPPMCVQLLTKILSV